MTTLSSKAPADMTERELAATSEPEALLERLERADAAQDAALDAYVDATATGADLDALLRTLRAARDARIKAWIAWQESE